MQNSQSLASLGTLQPLSPIVNVPRRFWDREFGGCPLPKAVNVAFEVAGQQVDDVSAHGYVSVAEDSELRLSGLWVISQDRFPGHLVIGWSKIGEDTIKLQLQPPDDEPNLAIDRKRQAPADLPEPQAKLPALSSRHALEWESPRDQFGHAGLMDWRQEGRDGARLAAEPPQRLVSPTLLPAARLQQQRRGGSGGRVRGGSRSSATGRGCAKLVRTTTRLYIGVGQVRDWLGEVGARTELQVKVMLDNRLLQGNHQADLLYNKGAHYYWITSRTLKRTAMGKWFLGWSHTQADGLVLLLRSPSKDEIAAAIAEGFQGKDDDEDTEISEQQQQQLQQQLQQQQMLLALSPPSPLPNRIQQSRSLSALGYTDEEAMLLLQQQQQQTPASELEDLAEGAHYRPTPLQGGARLGGGDEDDAVSGLSGENDLRRALGPSDPRLMVALAAAELQRGLYGSSTPGSGGSGQNLSRRPMSGYGAAGPGPGRQYPAGRDGRETPQQLVGSRPPSGSATPGSGGAQAPYREPPGRSGSEGLNAAAAAVTPGGPPRNTASPPSRYTNFAEVPGGTAFANVALPAEALATEPSLGIPQQHRGGGPNVPSQLGATTSIASNLSLGGPTQATGASMLQASGVAGPIAAPLRLPTNVSELLPPEYLPAAVSVRCTLDGNLQQEIYACEIHRNRQGHCYLYNLPPSVLEGRSQQDWMISEDGCLVICLKTVAPGQALVENKSVRSNPSNLQAGMLPGGTSVNAESPTGARAAMGRTQCGLEKPSLGRTQRNNSDGDLAVATAAAAAAKPQAPDAAASPKGPEPQDPLQQPMEGQAFDAEVRVAETPAAETQPVIASLPVPERKMEGRRERPPPLLVPRQAIESLYGLVEMPHPVLVRFQINEEPEQQVYLAEVADMGGDQLIIRGTPSDALVGRTLVGWRRAFVLSHQLLVVCLETRPDVAGQAKAGAPTIPARGGREGEIPRARGEPGTGPQGGGAPASGPHHQQPQPPSRPGDHWGATAEGQGTAGMRQFAGVPANPFASAQHQQLSLSGVAAPSSGSQPSHRTSVQQHQPAAAPSGAGHRQQQPALQQRRPSGDSSAVPGLAQQPLQPVFSTLLPGVGSSKLPPSHSLVNNSSNSLLPAQASNLPFTSSVRPEGLGSAATGGGAGAGARPVNAGTRGAGAGGSTVGGAGTSGQRAAPLDVDSRAGATLQTVASATQSPYQAPGGSRPPAAARAAPAAPVFSWPLEVGGGGQAATPTVFAQFGVNLAIGQEPSSPKAGGGGAELSHGAPPKRLHQQGAAHARGSAGPHGGGNEGALMHRSTTQTADFSSVTVGSLPRNGQQQHHHQSLHGGGRQADDVEMDQRRSPQRAGGEQEAAATSRGRWQHGTGAEQEALGLPTAAASESAHGMRCLPSQGIHRRGSGGTGAEAAGHAATHDAQPQPSRPRPDRPQPHSPWRYEAPAQPPSQQQQQQSEDLGAPAPSLASLPAGGLGREGRWGSAAAASPDTMAQGAASEGNDPRAHLSGRYADEAFAAVSNRPRSGPAVDDMDTAADEGPGPAGATAPSPRRVDAYDTRPHQGFVRSGDANACGGGSGAGDVAMRHAYNDTTGKGDVEMEEADQGLASTAVLQLASRQQEAHGRGQKGEPGASGIDEQRPSSRGVDSGGEVQVRAQQQNQGMLSWQRRGEAGHLPPEAGAHQGYDQEQQGPTGAELSSRHCPGGAKAGALEHGTQAQDQWYPRMDLTGTTVLKREHGATEGLGQGTNEEDRVGRSRASDDGESGNGDRPLHRRPNMLRMLSVVVHEPEDGDKKQQQQQQRQQEQQQRRN